MAAPVAEDMSNINMAVTEITSTTKPSNNDTTTGTSAGVIGAVLLVAAIVAAILIRRRMRIIKKQEENMDDSVVHSLTDQNDVEKGEMIRMESVMSEDSLQMPVWQDVDDGLKHMVSACYIDRRRLELGKIAGKGQFGLVYEACLSRQARTSNDYGPLTHTKVAVKTLKGSNVDTETVEAFVTEGMIMKDFNHKNVLTLIGVTLGDHGVPMIILPFMKNGSLKKYVGRINLTITVRELLNFALQVAEGMQYLVTQKFVHRDLACRNCMLDEDMLLKVADFGLSRDIYTKEYYSSEDKQAKLPVKWMALESLNSGIYSTKTDVWSYGILLWELLTRGSVPYPDVANWEVRGYIQSGRRMSPPPSCPEHVGQLMKDCWESEPKSRPSFEDIIIRLNRILRPVSIEDEGEYEEDHEYFNLYVNAAPEEES